MSPSRPGIPRAPGPPGGGEPLEQGRARGMFAGLMLFGLGSALAGLLAAGGHGRTAPYLVAIVAAFGGLAVLALFVERGSVPLPPGPIWAPAGLAMVGRSAGLPALVVQSVIYGLIAVGVIGNIVIPLLRR